MNKPFVVILPSDDGSSDSSRLQRTRGESAISFKLRDGATCLDRLFQSGAAKIRLPKVAADATPVAVLINSAGGLTGGDRLVHQVGIPPGARAAVTTQACERIYRSSGGSAEIATTLDVAGGGRLDWLPQETILFNGGRLSRRLNAELAADAVLLAVESIVLGRAAHGEIVNGGLFRDRWRIRQGGKLLFADDLLFDWADAGLTNRQAIMAGGAAAATILYVGPEPQRHVERLRTVIGSLGGVSAWNGKLLARIVAEGGAALRRVVIPALMDLLDGAALPKLWQM